MMDIGWWMIEYKCRKYRKYKKYRKYRKYRKFKKDRKYRNYRKYRKNKNHRKCRKYRRLPGVEMQKGENQFSEPPNPDTRVYSEGLCIFRRKKSVKMKFLHFHITF